MKTKKPLIGDLRIYLQQELLRRCKANPAYSLRSFAQSLGINHGALSQILSGKRSISKKMKEKIMESLDLDPRQWARFLKEGKEANPEEEKYIQISMDAFEAISEWYYMAILELLLIKDFDPSPRWMAQALDLSINQVTIALERLERLGMIKRDSNGNFVDLSDGFSTNINARQTNSAKRLFQKQILEKSAQALEKFPLEKRNHSGLTMAISTKKLEAAKEMIKNFRRELCNFLQADDDKDEVYQLAISLYPLTEIGKYRNQEKSHEI